MGNEALLRLDPVAQSRARAFLEGRLDGAAVDSDPVLSRWRRVAALGVSCEGVAHPDGVRDGELAERRAGLLAAIEAASDQAEPWDLASGRRVAVLADRDGVIVRSRVGDPTWGAARARLVEGADWSEGVRGTNAIGTAIAERRGVAVIGGAHFERENHGLFCYATPIVDPYGELVGVFDVSGHVEDDDPLIGPAVRHAGRAFSTALRTCAYGAVVAGGLRLVERMLERSAGPALLLEAPGIVRRANARVADLLGVRDGVTTEQLFGVSWEELAREALTAGASPTFETRTARFALTLEPILGSRGRVLSIVAYLDPASPARRPSDPPPAPPRASPALAHFEVLRGEDPMLARAKTLAARFAPTPVPVLLLAETGTGKELLARAIHAASPRAKGPFVAVNCGALSPQLLETELFGYAPGSFTGARDRGQDGKIEAASGGTLFLDEIAETSASAQAMLLRVLEDGSYSRVGEPLVRRSDFRLICATCRDLHEMTVRSAFRSDLYYRIQGATLSLPALRDRRDRVALAETLLVQLAQEAGLAAPPLDASARLHVERHDWPGNVRELKSALRHALYLSTEDGVVRAEHFPQVPLSRGSSEVRSRRAAMDAALATALAAAQGNLSEAARRLGISRSTLYRQMQKGERGPKD